MTFFIYKSQSIQMNHYIVTHKATQRVTDNSFLDEAYGLSSTQWILRGKMRHVSKYSTLAQTAIGE